MGGNKALAFVSVLCIMAVCCWIGHKIDYALFQSRKRRWEIENPGEAYEESFSAESGIGFGSLGGIALIALLQILG